MVGEGRFELPTSRVQGGYANQTALFSEMVTHIGLEPISPDYEPGGLAYLP